MSGIKDYNFFIEKAIMLLEGLHKKKFSLVVLYPPNESYMVEMFHKLFKHLENCIYVSDKIDAQIENVKRVHPKAWESVMAQTQNAFIIYNDFKGDIKQIKEEFKDLYPVVYVIYKDKSFEPNEEEKDKNWKAVVFENSILLVNKKIRKFTSLVFSDFETQETVKNEHHENEHKTPISDLIDLNFDDDKPPITKQIEPVGIQKPNEENFDIFKNLPLPSMEVNHKNAKWRKEFYNYLHTLIGRILPPGKEKLMPYILNKETINDVWLKVFTHEIEDPTVNQNYEIYEAIGDRVLKYVFTIYYQKRFPYAAEKDIADASKEFQSDVRQAATSEKMGLINWLHGPKELKTSLKIHEDLYEAFFGGLELILNKYTVVGNSTQIVFNMFCILYDDFDFSSVLIDPKTWVNQLIEGIAKKKFVQQKEKNYYVARPKEIEPKTFDKIIYAGNIILKDDGYEPILSDKDNSTKSKDPGFDFITLITSQGQTESRVVLNQYGSDVLTSYGFDVQPNMLMGSSTEATSKPSIRNASAEARLKLYAMGITGEWKDEMKRKKTFAKISNFKQALAKAKSMHSDIIDLDMTNPMTLKRDSFYQLIGITKTHKKYLLKTYVSPDKTQNNFQIVIDKFLEE